MFETFYSLSADDGQIMIKTRANSSQLQLAAVQRLQDAMQCVGEWMNRNKLKLNGEKLEFRLIKSFYFVLKANIKKSSIQSL